MESNLIVFLIVAPIVLLIVGIAGYIAQRKQKKFWDECDKPQKQEGLR